MAETEHDMMSKAELVEDVNIISGDQIYTLEDPNVVIENAGEGGAFPTYIQVSEEEYVLLVADSQAIEDSEQTAVVVEAPVQESTEPEMSINEIPRTRRTNRMFHRTRGRENKNAANNESVYDFEEEARNASTAEGAAESSAAQKQDEEDEDF